jgi:predicted DNA-binding protein YlxM (UPF0122 family)
MQTIQIEDINSMYLLKNALDHELDFIQNGIKRTEENLKEFENKFEMSSDEFYRKYHTDEIEDSIEIMRWASEIQILHKLTSDYIKLKGMTLIVR